MSSHLLATNHHSVRSLLSSTMKRGFFFHCYQCQAREEGFLHRQEKIAICRRNEICARGGKFWSGLLSSSPLNLWLKSCLARFTCSLVCTRAHDTRNSFWAISYFPGLLLMAEAMRPSYIFSGLAVFEPQRRAVEGGGWEGDRHGLLTSRISLLSVRIVFLVRPNSPLPSAARRQCR